MALGVDLQSRDMNLLASMVRSVSDYFNVPVCLHLDHATDFSMITKAIDAGFSSVMYDGSVLDFDNNAKNTAQVVKHAHAHGITVEAELVYVGNGSVGSISRTGTDTDPGESLSLKISACLPSTVRSPQRRHPWKTDREKQVCF